MSRLPESLEAGGMRSPRTPFAGRGLERSLNLQFQRCRLARGGVRNSGSWAKLWFQAAARSYGQCTGAATGASMEVPGVQ